MKKVKSLLSIVLTFMMVVSMVVLPVSAADADIWDGTADTSWYNNTATSFTLTTAEQLAGLANLVNNGNGFSGKTIYLGADIQLQSDDDMDNYASWSTSVAPENKWKPIGYYNKGKFQGTFDGMGHTISGMYINDSAGKLFGGRPALFGFVTGSIIKNLTVTKSFVTGNRCTGIIAAYSEGAVPGFESITVSDCTAIGDLDGTSFIMGKMAGFTTLNIIDCHVSGSITCKYWGGGLVGYLSGSNMGTINIIGCSADIELTGTYENDRGSGGLIGHIGQYNTSGAKANLTALNIIDSNVSLRATANRDIGGVIGTVFLNKLSNITFDGVDVFVDIYCHNGTTKANISDLGAVISYLRVRDLSDTILFRNMSVLGTVRAGQNSGGLIGRINAVGAFVKINSIEVDNVDMDLDIICKKGAGAVQCIGGIIGNSQNKIGTLTVRGLTTTNTYESLTPGQYFGGLVGSCPAGITVTVNASEINDSYINLKNNVGGLFGSGATVLEISDSEITVNIEGENNLGGLVGSATKLTSLAVTNTDINATINGGENMNAGAIAGTFGTVVPEVTCTDVNITVESTGKALVGEETEAVLIGNNFKIDSNVDEMGMKILAPSLDECKCRTPNWGAWTVDKVMVCRPGYEEEGHSYRVCETCGGKEEMTIKVEHRWSKWNTSCTLDREKDGYVNGTRVCAACATIEASTELMAATHEHTMWTQTIAPTATASGEETLFCTDCDKALMTRPVLVTGNDPAFSDIAGHKYEADINFVVEHGLFNGMEAGKFEPETAMTRGMIITVFARLANVDVALYENRFTDVNSDSYYAPYIGWAESIGIINGYGDGTFRPNEAVTKEQAIAMISRYLTFVGNRDNDSDNKADFTDLDTGSEWAKNYVAELIRLGIVKSDATTLRPSDASTRAELANYFANLVKYLAK